MSQVRMTKQRAIILEELRKVKTHPTADEVYNRVREILPHISLGTVYRNLDFLAETGQILRLEYAGSTMRFDGDISSHQHVRCIRCGKVGDVMPFQPSPSIKNVCVQGFDVITARIEYDGICSCCSSKQQ